jgi:hypothetical protein
MTEFTGVRAPNPLRARCIRSVFLPAPLEDVALAVAEATVYQAHLYVERLGDRWRWSLVHPGGGYPLLRIAARYLQVDYTAIFIGFRTVVDGVCVLAEVPDAPTEPDQWAVVDFDGPTPVDEVTRRILSAFHLAGA